MSAPKTSTPSPSSTPTPPNSDQIKVKSKIKSISNLKTSKSKIPVSATSNIESTVSVVDPQKRNDKISEKGSSELMTMKTIVYFDIILWILNLGFIAYTAYYTLIEPDDKDEGDKKVKNQMSSYWYCTGVNFINTLALPLSFFAVFRHRWKLMYVHLIMNGIYFPCAFTMIGVLIYNCN